MSYRDPRIPLSNHTKVNLGDNRKSDTNQKACYLLHAYIVDCGAPPGSDKDMDKEQVENICMPTGHTVAGKTGKK